MGDREIHYHIKVCPLRHEAGRPGKCGLDYEHFLDVDFCQIGHNHTHDGKPCVCEYGHYHEQKCERDHWVANSPSCGRLYLGSRVWSFYNDQLDTRDTRFLITFLSLASPALRELYHLGLDPGEVYELCLEHARDSRPPVNQREIQAGRKILKNAADWLRTIGTKIPSLQISVAIPEASTSDCRIETSQGRLLSAQALIEMLSVIKEVRDDKLSTLAVRYLPVRDEEPGKRIIGLPPCRVAPELLEGLDSLEQILHVIHELLNKEEGKPPRTAENSFIRQFASLARDKTRRPLDNLAVRFFEVTFARSIDLSTYTRRRSDLEASAGSRGALERAANFLREALKAGPRSAKDLTVDAWRLGIRRTTLYRAAATLGVAFVEVAPGKAHQWSLATRGSTDRPNRK